jgi:predicted TIM-barrel fold metal-dependent hydrolase
LTEPADRRLRVIDPHIHLCDMSSGLYPHFADREPGTPFSRTYALADFIAEAAPGPEIAGAVHVEAFPTDPVRETAIVQEIAEASPFPIVMVGNADLLADDFEAVIDGHARHPVFRGIRQVVNVHRNPAYTQAKSDLLNAPRFSERLRRLGDRGFSFDLQLLGHQMARAAEVAGECPQTRIVVNHAGLWMDRTPEGWRLYKEGLRGLAACPNVAIKISGMGMREPEWTALSIRPVVFEVLEAFGPGRAMFASNFPVDRAWSSYERLWQAYDDAVATLGEDERDRLFGGSAREIYRI